MPQSSVAVVPDGYGPNGPPTNDSNNGLRVAQK